MALEGGWNRGDRVEFSLDGRVCQGTVKGEAKVAGQRRMKINVTLDNGKEEDVRHALFKKVGGAGKPASSAEPQPGKGGFNQGPPNPGFYQPPSPQKSAPSYQPPSPNKSAPSQYQKHVCVAKGGDRCVIGISGVSRGGKGWVSKGLLEALESMNLKATIVGQDDFWFQACQVNIKGEIRQSEEQPECTNHEKFAYTISEKAKQCQFVIAEGFQLVHDPKVVQQLDHIFLLDLDRAEAKRRRCQPKDAKLNPNPLPARDFEDILWPCHEQYMKDKVRPLGNRIMKLPSPNNVGEQQARVHDILRELGINVQSQQKPAHQSHDKHAPHSHDKQDAKHQPSPQSYDKGPQPSPAQKPTSKSQLGAELACANYGSGQKVRIGHTVQLTKTGERATVLGQAKKLPNQKVAISWEKGGPPDEILVNQLTLLI